MSTPTKKRKITSSTAKKETNPKGILYFFNKQTNSNAGIYEDGKDKTVQTDEELARELQERWNKEDNRVGTSTGDGKDYEIVSAALPVKRKAEELDGIPDGIDGTDGISNEDPKDSKNSKNSKDSKESKESKTQPEQETSKQGSVIDLKPPLRNPFDLSSVATTTDVASEINTIPFDLDPFAFDPTSYLQLPKPTPYALLAHAFTLVNSTRSRIKISDTLTNLLRVLILHDSSALLPAVWLTTNDIAPPYEGVEYGIGSQILSKAIQNTSGISAGQLRTLFNKMGDAGDVAFEAKSKQRTLGLRKPTALSESIDPKDIESGD